MTDSDINISLNTSNSNNIDERMKIELRNKNPHLSVKEFETFVEFRAPNTKHHL